MPKTTKLALSAGAIWELDPSKSYLLCFDQRFVSKQDVADLLKSLPFKNATVAMMVAGDPNTAIKIIEE